MKAMILAAGLGTRLKPLTDTMPKALVPILGKPLLQHVIEKLKSAGFNEIIINVHHFAEQIIDFIKLNNSFELRIEFSDESNVLLDTGGAIKKASWFFDDDMPFLVHNVDIFSNVDLKMLYESHIQNNADVSLVVSMRDTFRYLLFDEDNKLYGWINEKTGETKSPYTNLEIERFSKYAFSGIHIISPSLFKHFDKLSDMFSIIDFYLSICNKKEVIGFVPNNFFMYDVGKIDTIDEIEKILSNKIMF